MATALLRGVLHAAGRLAVLTLATGAATLADGSLAPPITNSALTNEVEGSLVRAIVELRTSGGLKNALDEINKTLAYKPNFRLAQLVRGDILMAQAGRPVAFASNAVSAEDLAPLQDEARVRVQRYLDAPPIDDLPAALVQLSPRQAHVIVIDTSRSRLYVYANDLGRARYVADFYISLGRFGVDKAREGDQKTPIGIYTIVGTKEGLPDFYGPRAYPLSYPNDWDRLNGRQGHGIWLHGTPSATYSRPPYATDGCVVLTNDDLARVARYVDVTHTPVVIDPSIAWRDPQKLEADRTEFLRSFEGWRSDWESRDNARYLSHYSSRFPGLSAFKARKRQVNANKAWLKIGVDDLSLFAYPGVPDMMMATFEQDYRSSNMSNRRMKRQYWIRENGEWRIFHESLVS